MSASFASGLDSAPDISEKLMSSCGFRGVVKDGFLNGCAMCRRWTSGSKREPFAGVPVRGVAAKGLDEYLEPNGVGIAGSGFSGESFTDELLLNTELFLEV